MRAVQADMRRMKEENEAAAARIRSRNDEEIEDLKTTIRRLEGQLEKSSKEHVQDLQTAHEDYTLKLSDLEARLKRAEDKAADAEARSASLQGDVDAKEEARQTAQGELDDLFIVLGDLEEKRANDKVCSPSGQHIHLDLIWPGTSAGSWRSGFRR